MREHYAAHVNVHTAYGETCDFGQATRNSSQKFAVFPNGGGRGEDVIREQRGPNGFVRRCATSPRSTARRTGCAWRWYGCCGAAIAAPRPTVRRRARPWTHFELRGGKVLRGWPIFGEIAGLARIDVGRRAASP